MMMDTGSNSGFHRSVMSGLGRRHRISMGLRMTPMIDVIFLLLIFFVLTAKFRETEQILPVIAGKTPPQASVIKDVPLKITVQPDPSGCQMRVADHPPVTLLTDSPNEGLLALVQTVEQALEQTGPVPIELYYDDAVSWDVVVKVYDVLYGLGLKNITFRIEE